MIALTGQTTRLRAVEPDDLELMYVWENDADVWSVSGTTSPFSRHTIEKFIENQKYDISETHQLRLIIETLDTAEPIGTVDLYEYDVVNGRAGIGILIYDPQKRSKGYAADALQTVCDYARHQLYAHQLWCTVSADNAPSLALFRKVGFEQTGTKRDWNRHATGYTDEIVLQKMLNDDLNN